VLIVASLAACVAVPATSGIPAAAQEGEVLTINVARVVVPNTRAKLLDKGVLVKAKCNLDCVIVVKVRVPQSVAKELGLKSRVIGSGAAGAKADQLRWVRARINKGAGEALEDFGGGGRLDIRIKALP
jgi:hypothetical protein